MLGDRIGIWFDYSFLAFRLIFSSVFQNNIDQKIIRIIIIMMITILVNEIDIYFCEIFLIFVFVRIIANVSFKIIWNPLAILIVIPSVNDFHSIIS